MGGSLFGGGVWEEVMATFEHLNALCLVFKKI